MKRSIALAALAVAALSPSAGRASHTQTGSAAVPNPNGAVLWGVTERGALCDPASPLNGVDGKWYPVPSAHIRARVTPTGPNAAVQDLNIYWYVKGADGSCTLIAAFSGAGLGNLGVSEASLIPGGATHMIVDLIIGGAATWNVAWT